MKIYLCVSLVLFSALSAHAGDITKVGQAVFVRNVGQITDQYGVTRVDLYFKLSANGLNMFFGRAAMHYQWNRVVDNKSGTVDAVATIPGTSPSEMIAQKEYCRLDVELVGADKTVLPVSSGTQSYYENYFTPASPDGVRAETFAGITYRNIYPNIDWVIYAKDGKVKYDFIVHPGGNVQDIRIRYNGAQHIQLEEGNLHVSTAFGSITEPAPYTYNADNKQAIASKFVLNENELSFHTSAYTGTMVIDPTLEWATYYGGSDYEFGQGSAVDPSGNVYMGGWCLSSNNIATTGAYISTLPTPVHATYFDGFLVKFNLQGQRLWATYYPANVSDVACDNNGNVYITGGADSIPGLATTGAYQTAYAGKNQSTALYNHGDAYLAKFSSSGTRIWATFYGGPDNDHGASVACDAAGNVYVGGATHSTSGIASTGAFKTVFPTSNLPTLNYSWGKAGFLAKFNSSGTRQWGTYFAGHVADIEVDAGNNNNIYITGITWHDTGVATTGAYQTTHSYSSGNNLYEGYIAKFNASGARQWGTYFGGPAYDILYAVETDNSGNIYVSGQTNSTSGISSTGSYQSSIAGAYDALLAKFNSSGTRIWSTYYGGTQTEYAIGLAITPQNRVFITGPTSSTSGIATTGAYKTSFSGSLDDYIIEFNTSGARLYGTYYGGSGYEYGWGANGGAYFVQGGDPICYNENGRLHLASSTSSSSGIATSGAHQATHGGGTNAYDAYLATFIVDTLVYIVPPFNDTSLCPGDTFKVIYKTTYPFKSGNVFTVQLSGPTGSFASPVTVGSKAAQTGDTIVCVAPVNAVLGTGYRVRITASNPSRTSAINDDNIKINTPPVLTAANSGPVCESDTVFLSVIASYTTNVSFSWTGPGSYTSSIQNTYRANAAFADSGDYVVTATIDGCSSKDTTHVIVKAKTSISVPVASSNSPVCPGSTINLTASSTTPGVTYAWTGPSGFSTTTQNPVITNANATHSGNYAVTATLNGCTSAAGNTNVQVLNTTTTPVATANSPICTGQDLTLFATTVSGATYNWQGPAGFSSTSQNPVRSYVSKNMAGKYSVTATKNGCTSPADTVTVVVNDGPEISIFPSPDDSICPGGYLLFIGLPSNTGTAPVQYQWLKNGQVISGAASVSYGTGNITGGDMIRCILTSAGNCSGPVTDTSNTLTLKNKPVFTPAVSISAKPGTEFGPYTLVTFTASYTGGGKTPKFQWLRNGTPVIGAVNSIWGTTDLSDGDSISVRLISSDSCAQPRAVLSNVLGIRINLSVDDVSKTGLRLAPNPNNGRFTLTGYTASKELSLKLYNSIGQLVDNQVIDNAGGALNAELNYSGKIAAGIYFLHIHTEDDIQVARIVVE